MTWYVNNKLKVHGPCEFDHICNLVRRGDIGPRDLIMKEGMDWQPAASFSEIPKNLFPAFQALSLLSKEDCEWFYLIADPIVKTGYQMKGPVRFSEIRQQIEIQSISEDVKIWRQGLTGWVSFCDRLDFI